MYTENSTGDQCHTIQAMVSVADNVVVVLLKECWDNTIFVVSAEVLLLPVQVHIAYTIHTPLCIIQVPQLVLVVAV